MTDKKKIINRIKTVTAKKGASSRLLSLWVNVDYTTVSQWNSNNYQPSSDKLNKIGGLLETDNRELLEPQNRVDTGLAKALQGELDRLHKEEKIPYEVEKKDSITGKIVRVNNPKLIKALKNFAKNYKK
jgi:ribosome-binding protein aMBF1 (putative translation factor)